jgi:hypothetical protein
MISQKPSSDDTSGTEFVGDAGGELEGKWKCELRGMWPWLTLDENPFIPSGKWVATNIHLD